MPPKVEAQFIRNLAESFAKGQTEQQENWLNSIQKSDT
jgi:hypothetical protein